MLLTKSIIGTQILKDSAVYMKQVSHRVLNDQYLSQDFSLSTALIYLNLFENARIASQLTSEDQFFSKNIQNIIATWISNGHAKNKTQSEIYAEKKIQREKEKILAAERLVRADNIWKEICKLATKKALKKDCKSHKTLGNLSWADFNIIKRSYAEDEANIIAKATTASEINKFKDLFEVVYYDYANLG
jgi:hypothetical protein